MLTILLALSALMALGIIIVPVAAYYLEYNSTRICHAPYGSNLERYINSKNPMDVSDVERFTREYDLKSTNRFPLP